MNDDVLSFTVGRDESGARLDSFLAAKLDDLSRTRLQKSIQSGDVLVNEIVSKPSYRLREGDVVEIDLPEPPPCDLVPENIPIKIVHEDRHLMVVDKPAGMLVHPGAGVRSGTLANALAFHFSELSGKAGAARPGIVHRLDRETSGLLVVARDDRTHELLSDQFRARLVDKSYIALVHGRPAELSGEIRFRIGRSSRNRTKMAVVKGQTGREAHTLFNVSRQFNEFALLDVVIRTGRTHQIRVHLSHIGHPVVGDETYGGGRDKTVRDPAVRRAIAGLNRHFLHSAKLGFTHPRTGERLEFRSPLPRDLEDLLGLIERGSDDEMAERLR